jgi:hypothetical protein
VNDSATYVGSVSYSNTTPKNILTRRGVSSCIFGKDAVLFTARQTRHLLLNAGFRDVVIRFILDVPAANQTLQRVDRLFGRSPLGHNAMRWNSARFQNCEILNCLILAAIPISMSAVNSSWLYTRIGWLDPWTNVGYFLHYNDPTFLNWYYKISRLSWILPGFAAYHIFRPIVANYLLHVGYLLVSVIFFYLTVARLFGAVVAFATAACLATFTPFDGSGEWDYQNAGAGAYYIVSFYLLTCVPGSKNERPLLIGAGAAYAASVHATIGFINLVPILAGHFLVLHHDRFGRLPTRRSILETVLWFAAGAVALTAMLGLVNAAIGRDFLFYKPLLNLVISFLRDNQNQTPWWVPWSSGWMLSVYSLQWIAPNFAALLGCIACTVFAILRRQTNRIAISLQIQYIFVGTLWIVWQSLGQTALQPEYFAYPLYPVMFFAVAGIAATWKYPEKLHSMPILFYVVLAIIVVLPLTVPAMAETLVQWTSHIEELSISLLAVLSISVFAAAHGRPIFLAVAVLSFSISNAFAAAASDFHPIQDYSYRESCKDRAGAYSALIDSNLFLTRFVPSSPDMLVWWDHNEVVHDSKGCSMALTAFAKSMTSFGLSYLAIPWQGMPEPNELPASSISAILGEKRLAIPTADPANVDRIRAQYAQNGIKLTVVGQMPIRTSRFAFNLYVLSGVQAVAEPAVR